MARRIAAEVAALLRTDAVQRINFHLGGLGIEPRDFDRMSRLVETGKVKIELGEPRELGPGVYGTYSGVARDKPKTDADTIRFPSNIDLSNRGWQAIAVHECVHAIIDMHDAGLRVKAAEDAAKGEGPLRRTRRLAGEVAAHLAEALYVYQEAGAVAFDHYWQQTPSLAACRDLVDRYFLGQARSANEDRPVKANGVWLAPLAYQGMVRALKAGPYSYLGWRDVVVTDGIGGGEKAGEPARAEHRHGGQPVSIWLSEDRLDSLVDELRQDFGGGLGAQAGLALERATEVVRRRADDGYAALVGASTTHASGYDELLDAARDLARSAQLDPGRDPAGGGPSDVADLLDEARAWAAGADLPAGPAAGVGPPPSAAGVGGQGWPGPVPTQDFASMVGARAAEQVADASIWSRVRDEALSLAQSLAMEAAASVDATTGPPGQATVADAGVPGAGTGVGAYEAALGAARQAWETYDWGGYQQVAADEARETATFQASRTLSEVGHGWLWDRLGDALDGADALGVGQPGPGAWDPGAAGAGTWHPDSGVEAGGGLGTGLGTLGGAALAATRSAFDVAATSVTPFVQDALHGGLDFMRDAAFQAATSRLGGQGGFGQGGFGQPGPGFGQGGFGQYDAGFGPTPR